MGSETIKNLMIRLLELEQRFDSYYALHETELEEIKLALSQLRESILGLSRELDTTWDRSISAPAPREGANESVRSNSPSDEMSI